MNITSKKSGTIMYNAPPGIDGIEIAKMANAGRDVLFVARDDVAMATMDEQLSFLAPDPEFDTPLLKRIQDFNKSN